LRSSAYEFTGLEGLDNAGIWMLNMNGRFMTQAICRVPSFSRPEHPEPTNTLSYNRYAYVNYSGDRSDISR
jgi:hypothetical protein